MKRIALCLTAASVIVAGLAVDGARAQWNTVQLLNEGTEAEIKRPRVVASALGGFHACYSAGRLRYRRYDGILRSPITLFTAMEFNEEITESLTGEIHVVFEDWSTGGPEVGWIRSTDGGSSFSTRQVISSSGGSAKHPQIAPLGLGASAQAVMSYWHASSKDLMFNRYTGLNWAGQGYVGANGNSEYEVMGIARSPVDGTAYRVFDNGPWLAMRQYNGSNWSGDINLDNVVRNGDSMHNRQQVAVNDAGQVMIIWDQGDRYYSILYVPGVGPGAATQISDQASWGKGLCAIPGTNDFYVVYPRSAGRVVGRRWTAGAWQAEETVMVGLADDFVVDPRVSADPNGSETLYCAFEYWGSGKPQAYYTIRPGSGGGPRGTVAGVVRDQYSVGVPGAIVSVVGAGAAMSGAGGAYTVTAPVGTYQVTANKGYYTGQSASGVQVFENQTTTVNFTITGQPPSPVASFSIQEGNTLNVVQWQDSLSGNSSGTRIRYSTTAPPATPSSGTLLLDLAAAPGSSHQHNHTGLTNGVRVYYAAFAYFQDVSRHYAGGVNASGTPAVQADYDRDGDVDQEDFAHFQLCLSGSFNEQNAPECQNAKFDNDEDVDMDDLAIFLNCMLGPGFYAEPQCADLP